MENDKYPYLKGGVIIAFLVIHFSISYFYTAPEEINSYELELASGNYMKPFFHQHWDLFAPEPPDINVTVEVSQDKGTTWRNLSEEILNEHYTYRVSPHGRIALAFGNSALYAADEWRMATTTNSTPEPRKSRKFLKSLCRKYLKLSEEDQFQVRITINSLDSEIVNQDVF